MERKDSLGMWGGELKSEFNLGHVTFQVSVGQPSEEDPGPCNVVWSPGERFRQALRVISMQVVTETRE